MEKRKIIFGSYDTALDGAWTVARLELTSPDFQSNLVQIPGRDGLLDLSTTLMGGEPRYNSRTLRVVLENSDDTRQEREDRIRSMIAELDGYRKQIWLPDDPEHYLEGRVRVSREYNDLAHCAVSVTATCDPWLYNNEETVRTLIASTNAQKAIIVNTGRKTVTPVVEVTGVSVALAYGGDNWTLTPGKYMLPGLSFRPGEQELTYSGTGTVKLTYREAVLL